MILGGKNEKTNCNENGECSTHRRNDRWISRLWKWRKRIVTIGCRFKDENRE